MDEMASDVVSKSLPVVDCVIRSRLDVVSCAEIVVKNNDVISSSSEVVCV